MRIPLFTCSFRATGLNLEKMCNLLKEDGIPLLKAKRAGAKTLTCRCYEADMPKVKELADSKGWTVDDIRLEGLSRARMSLIKRPGLIAGLIIMLALLITASRFVWRVDVRGAGAYQPDVREFLTQQGVKAGARAGSIDIDALEQKLYFRYPSFSWFTVARRGMTVEIICREGVISKDNEEAPEEALIALCDGLIERVETHAGTPAVKPGQLVKEGDVLIEGWERAADEERRPVTARGTVLARCWVSSRVSVPLTEWRSEQTGSISERDQIITPLFRYPSEPETPDFLTFDIDERLIPIAGAFFPVTLRRIVFREVALEKRARAIEDVKKEASGAAMRLLSELVNNDEIVDKWVDYCMIEGGEMLAIATAELRRNIAVPR